MPVPRLDGYTLLGSIGAGGMAELFLAERSAPGGLRRRVVLKRILPAFAREPHFRELFQHEARVAMRLTHANIVQVYDFLEADGTYVLEMEHVEGADLRRLVREGGPLALDAALTISVGVLRGLDHAHRRTDEAGVPLEIVHRDVSPGNILISLEGEVKVTDFGLARSREWITQSTGGAKGTFAFMAPEQAMGERVDARADVFAAAAVLYASISGKSPFEADGPLATLERVRAAALAPLDLGARFDELDAILRRAMARGPDQRFASAAAFREALEEFADRARLRLTPECVIARVRALAIAPVLPSPRGAQTATAEGSRPLPELELSETVLAVSPKRDGTQALPVRPRARGRPVALMAVAALGVALVGWRVAIRARAIPAMATSTAPSASGIEPARPAAASLASSPSLLSGSGSGSGSTKPRAARPGYLTVNVDPWAYVAVDGKSRGLAPLRELALAPGTHELTFENPELHLSRSRLVRLGPGERKTVIEKLKEAE